MRTWIIPLVEDNREVPILEHCQCSSQDLVKPRVKRHSPRVHKCAFIGTATPTACGIASIRPLTFSTLIKPLGFVSCLFLNDK